MRVAINAQLLGKYNTGVENYIQYLIENIGDVDKKCHYTIYSNDLANKNDKSNELQTICNYPLFPMQVRMIRILWEQCFLPFLLRKHKIDLLHAPAYVCPLYSHIPTILTVHDMIALKHPELTHRLNRYHYHLLMSISIKKAAHIIVPSENVKKDMIELLDVQVDKISVVPEGVDKRFHILSDRQKLEGIKRKYNLPSDFILFVGNLETKKNLSQLMKAFCVIKQKQLKHKLVFVGASKGWGKEVRNMEEEQLDNFDKHVMFLGYVPTEDLPAIYNLASLFVFPSLYEGFGIPPLEAMACGVPVIASNAGSLPEVLGEAAILVDPQSTHQLAEAMFRALTNPSLRSSLIELGVKKTKLYSWRLAAIKTVEVYEKTYRKCYDREAFVSQ